MRNNSREKFISLTFGLILVFLFSSCVASAPEPITITKVVHQTVEAPTEIVQITATQMPVPTKTNIPPTPTKPAPEGIDLPDSAVRSVNEKGQEVILDEPGGKVLWMLAEDEKGELAWHKSAASPEVIAATADTLNQELSAASSEYVNSLPGVNSPEAQANPAVMVVEYTLNNDYLNLHYDEEVGGIAAEKDGHTEWFFPNAGVVAVQEGPEMTADQINLEEGWFVRPERHTLEAEDVNLEVEIFNRNTGIVYEHDGVEERIYLQWQEMPEEARRVLLEDLVSRFGYRGTIWILIQDDLDGWGLRSEDWAEEHIHNETGFASKFIPFGQSQVKVLGIMSADLDEEHKDPNYYELITFLNIWYGIEEVNSDQELSADQYMIMRDELDSLYLKVAAKMPLDDNGDQI